MANKRKITYIRQSYCYLAIILLVGCGGDSVKFDQTSYIQHKINNLIIINNKIEA